MQLYLPYRTRITDTLVVHMSIHLTQTSIMLVVHYYGSGFCSVSMSSSQPPHRQVRTRLGPRNSADVCLVSEMCKVTYCFLASVRPTYILPQWNISANETWPFNLMLGGPRPGGCIQPMWSNLGCHFRIISRLRYVLAPSKA